MTTEKNPPADQATHGGGKRNADRVGSDAHRFEGSRNKTQGKGDEGTKAKKPEAAEKTLK